MTRDLIRRRAPFRTQYMHPTLDHHRGTRTGRFAGLGIALLLPVALVACGSDSTPAADTAPANEAPANEVQLKLIAFTPAKTDVAAGDTVTWDQRDPGFHTVTSGTVEQGAAGVTPKPDDRFASGQLATGKTFEHTFETPGTFPYFCEIHPATMRGEITVR